jgi:protein SCO1/2
MRATLQIASLLLFVAIAPSVFAETDSPVLPKPLHGVGIEQKLNAQVPLDTLFRDEHGTLVPLRSFFGKRPVLLAPVYYRCPMLCGRILSGMVAGLRPLSLRPGIDFEVVAISFNPAETPEDAANKRNLYSSEYSKRAGTNGWHFLVGSEPSIKAVTDAIGFHYHWDPETKMFVHGSGVMILTPEGRVARYFYGVEYEPKDLKLGLIEASHNRIGSPVDQILLFCYHYDPKTGKYGAVVLNALKLAAILVLATLGISLFFLWRRDLRTYKAAKVSGTDAATESKEIGRLC